MDNAGPSERLSRDHGRDSASSVFIHEQRLSWSSLSRAVSWISAGCESERERRDSVRARPRAESESVRGQARRETRRVDGTRDRQTDAARRRGGCEGQGPGECGEGVTRFVHCFFKRIVSLRLRSKTKNTAVIRTRDRHSARHTTSASGAGRKGRL